MRKRGRDKASQGFALGDPTPKDVNLPTPKSKEDLTAFSPSLLGTHPLP